MDMTNCCSLFYKPVKHVARNERITLTNPKEKSLLLIGQKHSPISSSLFDHHHYK
ncbi:hypothetical protein DFA_12367 [Cavenderia fasciculata]|uniref:Uncharacterized protein n=1 Tax=Cavenderia fasciculata TaxID=261658 RepID=F4QDH1_CACFS|nr:uncharacterized protein DFA_12367 [Cavenderia fasciculata]EGG14589.1 hypothetical protein DFA_12367 [Cavenderia fasciculata]|eukprot:XP_004366109.1 hypothetical protein DFA_12367 [Cavenderia fasciculata]